jgi:hypothetical protein
MEYSTAEKKRGTDETRHEATEEGPPGIAGAIGQGRDIGDPKKDLGAATVLPVKRAETVPFASAS